MIAFIDDRRGTYGVEPICKVLPIAPSTYRAHAAKRANPAKLSALAKRDAVRKIEIRRVFAENFEVDGVRRSGGNCAARARTSPDAPWSDGCGAWACKA
jgi:putative transposase